MNVDISAIAIILSVVGVGVALGRMIHALRADMHREMDLRFAHVHQSIAEVREDVREVRQDVNTLRGEMGALREEIGALRERTTAGA
ncbi:MAG: hypothetical protein OXK20_04195 [Deltaproteobacteria bacterium]|nr:hypothetical protein [Deltaproteobacteria bacterium]